MEEEKKTNLMPTVVIEFIIIVALLGLLAFTMLHKTQNKCKDEPLPVKNQEEVKPSEETPNKEKEPVPVEEEPVKSSDPAIAEAFKEYYEGEGLAKASNILTWDIPKVEKVDNSEYQDMYLLEGTFSCKNKTDDCVYLEQVGEPRNGKYDFSLYVQVTENNGKYTFKIYGTNLD